MSELVWEDEPQLEGAVLVTAFAGYFDAASASTRAVDWLVERHHATRVAHIESDGFFDFQQLRPQVVLEEGVTRRILWPENVVHVTRSTTDRAAAGRDLVLLSGIEPYIRWPRFCTLLLEVAERAGCEMVVTLGATPAQVPHTRMPPVFGSSTNVELATRLGLSRPQYQGITGVVGALQVAVDRIGLPSIAMRVGVPHYATGAHNPKATMALLRHLEHVTGVPTGHGELADDVADWERRLDEAVAEDDDARAYIPRLEEHFDREAEDQIPSADDLAREFERFLHDHRDEDGD
ncbi:MAG TPA: PAC2 family protein [Acidimicrobiia bacterium]|nr:PAC2 family protein [Acidimicrobiia bacterium]